MVDTDLASIGATGGITGSFIGTVFHRLQATPAATGFGTAILTGKIAVPKPRPEGRNEPVRLLSPNMF